VGGERNEAESESAARERGDVCTMSLDVQQEAQQDGACDRGEEAMAVGRSQGRSRGAPGMMQFPS